MHVLNLGNVVKAIALALFGKSSELTPDACPVHDEAYGFGLLEE